MSDEMPGAPVNDFDVSLRGKGNAMMTRTLIAVLLVMGGVVAHAQGAPRYANTQGDEYQLTRESDTVAVLEYLNSPANMSPGGDVELYHDQLAITVKTVINGGANGAERITVELPAGWVADPPQLDVRGGERGTVLLFRGEFLGM